MQLPGPILFSSRERLVQALVTLALVLGVGATVHRAELRESERNFGLEAHNVSLQVARRLAEGETLVAAVHGLQHSLYDLRDAQFPSIVRRIVDGHRQVRWMAYAERVVPGHEAAFQERLREGGFIGLEIHDFPGTRRSGAASEFRLPLYRVEPLTPGHARLLGADLMTRADWRTAVFDAIESGRITGTTVDVPEQGLSGLLLMRPLYRGNVEPRDPLSRRQQLAGMLMIFLDARALVSGLQTSDPTLQVSLLDGDHHGAGPIASAYPGQAEGAHDGGATHDVTFPMSAGRVNLPLEIRARTRPDLTVVAVAMILSSLFCLSVLHGLRLKRRARLEEQAAMERARLAQVTLHSIGEAVVRLDGSGRIRYMNPVAEQLSGLTTGTATGLPLEKVLHLELDGRVTGGNAHRIGNSHSNVILASPNGQKRAMACTLSPIGGEHGFASGQVLVMRDVSREDELSRELTYQATHDPLTDLPNRREFERRLEDAIASAHGDGRVHSVCYVDLDQFKLVNDTCGHAEGDRMLRQIAGVLATEVRGADTLARLGGDEFGVLLIDCGVERAMVIAERICRAVSAFRFISDDRAFELGASIGVVGIDTDSGTADEVQQAADLACYAAKDTGRNRAHLFRREDRVISRNHREMHWHVKIKEALETDRFVLHSQPIAPLHRGAGVLGMNELLLRMLDREGNLVPPMAFLPAAERYGLMTTLDRAVITQAFEHAASRPREKALYNINLSGQSLTDPRLAEFISSSAMRIGIEPGQVCFEVTETSAISNLALASQLMEQLRRRGFRFALDDFGAGLSSFGYLKQLPVDFIKIDGQFVRDINNDAVARAMVASIISVAKVLKIETVAEKVEDGQTMRCLRDLGVDYAQGFHIARPQPADEVTVLAQSA